MRGILRTLGAVAFCVAIVMPITGCRTDRESNEACAPPASVCEAAPAARKSIDGGTTPPAGSDAAKPVKEPNELRTPPRPPIIYGREADILPLSDEQVRRVKGIAADEQPGKEIWFIYAPLNKKMSRYDADVYNYRVVVYCKPDQQSARVRRGVAVYAHLSGKVLPPRVGSFSYAHLCETDEGFSNDPAVPKDLTRLPFQCRANISDKELVEVGKFIRSGPSVPRHLLYTPDGKRHGPLATAVSDPALPITSVGGDGTYVVVGMGMLEGPRSHVHESYSCQKINGVWTLVYTDSFVE